jgi:hypothetical protein
VVGGFWPPSHNGFCPKDQKASPAPEWCKARKSAQKGSLIFGFGGKRYKEKLIYIACVTDKLESQAYYQRQKYAGRPDCIYRVKGGRAERRDSARYHVMSDERKKDVGLRFENAFVLLSKDFRYLGKSGTYDYKRYHRELKCGPEAATDWRGKAHGAHPG